MAVTHKLVGNAMQMVICQLDAGQTVYAEAGKFLWKTTNVSLETRLSKPSSAPGGGGGAGGGLPSKALDIGKRALAGQSLAFQYFTAVDTIG